MSGAGETQVKALTARHTAVRRLISAHHEEFNRYHAAEREARGLPPDASSNVLSEVRMENTRLREALLAHGIDVE